MPVHFIVTCSNFVPELFLERDVCQLNVLGELIVLSVCFLCTAFKIFPSLIKTMNRYVRVRWFQHSPTRSDPLLPSRLCRVREIFVCKFSVLWCSIWLCQLYKFLLSISNAYGWKMYLRASTDGSLSLYLSLSHTHTHAHLQVGPVELFICSWQLLIRFHCNLTFFLSY